MPVCSFCEKSRERVERMVSGRAAFICNECVDLAYEIVHAPAPEEEEESPPSGDGPMFIKPWTRFNVRGVELEWCAHRGGIDQTTKRPTILINVRRYGEEQSVGGVFPGDVVPSVAEAEETALAFGVHFGIP